jgi:RNA-splicing ligase RtcB
VVRGLGNPLSWESCSHGAGRRLSRTEAKRRHTAKDLREQMAGRAWQVDQADALIDEIPSAYKDIDVVMAKPIWWRLCTHSVRSSTTREPDGEHSGQRDVGRAGSRPSEHATSLS